MDIQKMIFETMMINGEPKKSLNTKKNRVCRSCRNLQESSGSGDFHNMCNKCGRPTKLITENADDLEVPEDSTSPEDKPIIADDATFDVIPESKAIKFNDTVVVTDINNKNFGRTCLVESSQGTRVWVVFDNDGDWLTNESVRVVNTTNTSQLINRLESLLSRTPLKESDEYKPIYNKSLSKSISKSKIPHRWNMSEGKQPIMEVPTGYLYEIHSAHTMLDDSDIDDYSESYEDEELDGGEEGLTDEPSPEDIVITDRSDGGYSVSEIEGNFIGEYADYDEALEVVRKATSADNFYPSIWFTNDHGNTHNISKEVYESIMGGDAEEAPEGSLDDTTGTSELIPGGKAEDKTIDEFDPEQLAVGIKIEMEHTDDPAVAREISMDHLTEDPDYYIKLTAMEQGALDDIVNEEPDKVSGEVAEPMDEGIEDIEEEEPVVSPDGPEDVPGLEDEEGEKEENPAEYEYDCISAIVPENIAAQVRSFAEGVPDDILYTGDGSEEDAAKYGREMNPHLTLLYGMENSDSSELASTLSSYTSMSGVLGEINLFKQEDYDVIYVSVNGDDFNASHKALADSVEAPGNTHPEYVPHITIAYVRPGEGASFEGNDMLAGKEFETSDVLLQPAEGDDVPITLGNQSPEVEDQVNDEKIEVIEALEPTLTIYGKSIADRAQADSLSNSKPDSKVVPDDENPELFMVVGKSKVNEAVDMENDDPDEARLKAEGDWEREEAESDAKLSAAYDKESSASTEHTFNREIPVELHMDDKAFDMSSSEDYQNILINGVQGEAEISLSYSLEFERKSWGISDIILKPEGMLEFDYSFLNSQHKVTKSGSVSQSFDDFNYDINWTSGGGISPVGMEITMRKDGTIQHVLINMLYINPSY